MAAAAALISEEFNCLPQLLCGIRPDTPQNGGAGVSSVLQRHKEEMCVRGSSKKCDAPTCPYRIEASSTPRVTTHLELSYSLARTCRATSFDIGRI
jgi:hypothetical protein